MAIKEYSPFQPGVPVKPGLFVGREHQIHEIDRYLKQVRAGRQQNVFLIGDRGVGKSSLAGFVREYAEQHYNLFSVHAFLGGVSTLDEVVRKIFDELLKKSHKEAWFKRIKKLFGENIEEVGLFGISLKFNPPTPKLEALRKDLAEALLHVLDQIKEEKSGLMIILDDLNGTLDNEGFANWFKSLADRIAVTYPTFPVLFMLIGLPEKRNQLFQQQPSLMRVFQVMEIERLSDEEVEEFYGRAFGDANMTISSSALNLMVVYSSGLPILMHEIGDAAFWADADGMVDEKDAVEAIWEASERIGRKFLDPTFYHAVRSRRYISIIRKIGRHIQFEFTKSEVEANLSEPERAVFGNFLRKLKQIGIITQPTELPRGHYQFVNHLYPVYFHLESIKKNP